MPADDAEKPRDALVRDVLAAAVDALGGEERPGQVAMAEAVAAAMSGGEHLLVQAGTGTGKSLGYLVPALLHERRVVVATATLALQHQLVERDIPRLVEAIEASPFKDAVDTSHAVLKGRSNYVCLHRIREGVPDDQGALVELPKGSMAKKVLDLRAWAEERGRGRAAPASATTRRATPTASGGRSRSTTASAWARRAARSARSASSRWLASRPTAPT